MSSPPSTVDVLRGIGAILTIGGVVGLAYSFSILFWELPNRQDLREITASVSGPVGYRNTRGGAFAEITTSAYRGKIERLCFLWKCQLLPEIAALRPGTAITIWAKDDDIWQLSHDGKVLLAFESSEAAVAAQVRRGYLIFGSFLSLGIAFLIWDHNARSKMLPVVAANSSDVP